MLFRSARAGFAGPNIIEQTIRQKLPKGFQRSEFLLEHGAVDMIVPRGEMRDTVARILSKLTGSSLSPRESEQAADVPVLTEPAPDDVVMEGELLPDVANGLAGSTDPGINSDAPGRT